MTTRVQGVKKASDISGKTGSNQYPARSRVRPSPLPRLWPDFHLRK